MSGPLRVAVVYPDLLGTYGDGGNGLILARRAEWRGHDAELLQAVSDRPLPGADIYCLGGGEDGPQVRAARTLLDDGTLPDAWRTGRWCWRCAPASRWWDGASPVPTGAPRGRGSARPRDREGSRPASGGGGGGRTRGHRGSARAHGIREPRGPDDAGEGTVALGRVTTGIGNGAGGGGEGAVGGRVVGTYLHGPVLARNPALADRLLSWALRDVELEPLDDSASEALREERLGALRRRRLRRRK